MQTWAVIAQKGGQSKTTLATGFAVEAAREGAAVVILDADDRQGSALYWSERRAVEDVMVKDSSVAGLPLHVTRGRASGKIDLIIIDTPANSKDIAMLAAEQADFVIIPVAPRGLDVHSVLQTVKQVQQAGTPFAVILTQVPHQGGEGEEARAGFAAKGIALFESRLHFRKDFYRATPIGRTAAELEPSGKAAAELRAAFNEAKLLSGYATKQISEFV
ncbi:ParA family protein [Polymorphobacter megasporae]|uniref:ParA family protein n=1 Tax=Glacieibacterium megasporae TaxID=2835787 RepID=UPI001C1DDDC4|nr:ParA family protein [Polymorphobacter megasporae]UAJ12973.1 ParA family protein [Polymorphobacter megasporae]